MTECTVKEGSKELAVERKLVRDILKKALFKHGNLQLKMTLEKERVGERRGSYMVVYFLDRQHVREHDQRSSLMVSIHTLLSDWKTKDDQRIVVYASDTATAHVKRFPDDTHGYIHRSSKGKRITFDRKRDREHQIAAVQRMLIGAVEDYKKTVAKRDELVADRVAFNDLIKSLRSQLNVPKKNVWQRDSGTVEIIIKSTKRRETCASVVVSEYLLRVSLRIDDLKPEKVKEIIDIIKR